MNPKEEMYDEEMDGPGRSLKGTLEKFLLLKPRAFKGAELPARKATLLPLQLSPDPSLSENFKPRAWDLKSIFVVPKTPAIEQ